ncbi:enoyl-CoA hydratase/isomerase family protein [Actinomadura craniellae]|nr:enoyl-CoA hydratase-related protein [Actinomadura craniellae]
MADDDQDDALTRTDGVLLSRMSGSTLVVTLNRPDRANALDDELMDALAGLWTAAAANRSIRCVVVTGAGRAFCSGADASMLAGTRRALGDTAWEELDFLPGHRLAVPVVAAVNGVCAGGGLHFVADADISVAARSARFLDPHVSVGNVTALEPVMLRLRMRVDVLTRMVLLGREEVLDAAAAERAELVSEVVPDDELLPRALALAAAVGRNSPEAVRLSRRVLRSFEERLLGADLDLGWELVRRHRAHPDATEGPQAFLDKRPPRWSAD